MHSRTSELLTHLDIQRQVLRDAVASVPSARHDVQPEEGRWSVLGVLEHLSIVERRVCVALKARVDEARAAGLGEERDHSPILSERNVDQVIDRSVKFRAPEPIHPKCDKPIDALWGSLDESRANLKALVLSVDGLAVGDVMHPHPVFGPLSLYDWFAFVGSHEARHADQIREIGASLEGVV